MPLDELERRAWDEDPPTSAQVVAYCRGPCFVYAHEAVRRLSAARPPEHAGLEDG